MAKDDLWGRRWPKITRSYIVRGEESGYLGGGGGGGKGRSEGEGIESRKIGEGWREEEGTGGRFKDCSMRREHIL